MKRDFKFETLNGESMSNVKGGEGELTKDTHMSRSTDHLCGSLVVMVANFHQGCSSIEDSLIAKQK